MISLTYKDFYFEICRDLLLNKDDFHKHIDAISKDDNSWNLLINILIQNRLIAYSYHFFTCNYCKRIIGKKRSDEAKTIYLKYYSHFLKYEKIKIKIERFEQNNRITLIILKDNRIDGIQQFYPKYFYPLKYDIDLWGKEENLKEVNELSSKLGYKGHRLKFKKIYPVDQYEFTNTDKKMLDMEFRYQILAIRRFENLPVITDELRMKINEEASKNVILSSDKQYRLNTNWALIIRFLIFYFDDACQGMKHLYELWLFARKKASIGQIYFLY